MAKKPSEGKLLYHITHIDNMPSILKNGLWPRSKLNKEHVHIKDIANPEIITKREEYKNALSEYVLFHFYAKNPFDGAVCKTYGSENMVIITIKRKLYKGNEKFYIIPSHPLDSDKPDIYPYAEGFQKIRWDILDNQEKRDYHNPEIRKACMAECIVNSIVPVKEFSKVFVKSKKIHDKILQMKKSKCLDIVVNEKMFP